MVKKSEKQIPESTMQMEELNNLFEEAATPRDEFVQNLKSQVISQANMNSPQSNFISTLFMKFSQPTLRIGAVVTLLAIGAGAAAYSYLSTPQTFANQDAILAQIAQANIGVKKNTNEVAPLATGSRQDAKISSLYIRNPEDRTYNYKKITNTYDIGSAASRCSQMVPYQGLVTSDELVEYYSTKDESFPKYTKNTVFNGTDVYDYYLNVDSDQWQYRGGEYAVHLTNVQRMMPLAMENVKTLVDPGFDDTVTVVPTDKEGKRVVEDPGTITVTNSAPADLMVRPPEDPIGSTSVPVDPKDTIKNYFGEDAKIIGKETRNGKEYYKIQWSYKSTCGDFSSSPDKSISSSSVEFNQTMVTVAYADAKDFSIDGESLYLDSVAGRNLLYTRTFTESTKNVATFSDIKDEFTFTYAKPVRTVDASAYQYEKEYRKAMLEYLPKNMTQVVYLTGKFSLQSLSSSYVSVVPDHERHLIDRAFYSDKPYGQTMYNDSKDMFNPYQEQGKTYPKVQLSYAGIGDINWLNLSEVSSNLTGKTAIATLGIDQANLVAKGEIDVLVAGKTVKAQVFEQVQQSNTSPGSTGSGTGTVEGGVANDPAMPAPEQIMPRTEPQYRDVYIVFTVGDVTVIAQSGVMSTVSNAAIAKVLNFSSVGTADAELLDKALKVSIEVINGPTGGPELLKR